MQQSRTVQVVGTIIGGMLVAAMTVSVPAMAQSPGVSIVPASPAASVVATPAGGPAAPCVDGTISVLSSSELFPTLALAAEAYRDACPGVDIAISAPGSGGAMNTVLAGGADVAASNTKADTMFTPEQVAQLVDHPLVGVWAMVTTPDVSGVDGLTRKQARNVWTGKTTNWSKLGGPKVPITLVVRQDSAAHQALQKQILGKAHQAAGLDIRDSDNQALDALAQMPGAIALVELPYVPTDGSVRILTLDGVAPSVSAVADGTYPLAGTIGHLYTLGAANGLAAAFIDFLLGVTPTVPATSPIPDASPAGSATP